MRQRTMTDVWAQAEGYEPYMGRWSRLTPSAFVPWLEPRPGMDWLDVGCGTGALSHAILDDARPRTLVGLDRSSGFTAAACGGNTRLSAGFVIANGQALPVRTASFDRAVSALVLNFVASPTTMIAEMARAVRPAGMVGVYVWDYAGAMQLIRHFWDTAAELDPDAAALDEAGRFPICTPGNLEDLFSGEGLRDVDVRAIDVPTVFRDFDDYWSPFLGGQGPAPGHVASLGDDTRRELRDALRARMPYEADGSIRLVASPGAKW